MANGVGASSILQFPGSDPCRAAGPVSFAVARQIDTLWLPNLFLSLEAVVSTSRGMIPAGEVRRGDWLRMSKPDMSSVFREVLPREISGPAASAWRMARIALSTEPISVVDMMYSTIESWRQDHITVSRRTTECWWEPYIAETDDAWLVKVLDGRTGLAEIVPVEGTFELYGIQVAA